MGDALFDGAAFLYLRSEFAAGAFGIHVEAGEALAGFDELLLDFETGELPLFVGFFFFGDLIRQRFEFARGEIQLDGGLRGVAFKQAVFAGKHDAQAAFELSLQLAVALGLRGLALERIDLARDLFQDVVDAGEVLLGAFELGFGKALAGFELGDAGGFFDYRAAVIGLRAEDLADASLLDNGVAFGAKAGTHEEILDIAQAGGAAIDEVFALAGTVQAAGDGDLAGALGLGFIDSLDLAACAIAVDLGIYQRHGDVGHAERFAVARAGEDDVFHAGAAEALGRLFAEHPTDGIADVRFATPVRPHDGRDAFAVEAQFGALAKRFESL